jgi:hypothetical protein
LSQSFEKLAKKRISFKALQDGFRLRGNDRLFKKLAKPKIFFKAFKVCVFRHCEARSSATWQSDL